MNTNLKSPKVLAGIATALLIISLVGFMRSYYVNATLEDNLKGQQLRAESLLSEKLLLEKDIEKFKSQLASLTGTNSQLDKSLKTAQYQLSSTEAQFKKIQNQNASLKNIKKQHDELVALRQQLEQNVADLTNSLVRLQTENQDLSNTVASLEQRNSLLSDELRKAQFAALDQPRIETVKGKKERLTVSARRTKKMKVNFEVPAELQTLSYRIIDPTGKILSEKDGTIASRTVEEASTITASAENTGESIKRNKQVEMVYLTNNKLRSGIYKIEILNDNLYVGSLQVKLK